MTDLGAERLRITVPRARLLGLRFSRRGVLAAALVCLAAVALGALLDRRALAATGIGGILIVSLLGYLAWMSHLSWSRGARAFSLRERGLVVEMGDGPIEMPFTEIDRCQRVGIYLQIHAGEASWQFAILHIPPAEVSRLIAAIEAGRSCAEGHRR